MQERPFIKANTHEYAHGDNLPHSSPQGKKTHEHVSEKTSTCFSKTSTCLRQNINMFSPKHEVIYFNMCRCAIYLNKSLPSILFPRERHIYAKICKTSLTITIKCHKNRIQMFNNIKVFSIQRCGE